MNHTNSAPAAAIARSPEAEGTHTTAARALSEAPALSLLECSNTSCSSTNEFCDCWLHEDLSWHRTVDILALERADFADPSIRWLCFTCALMFLEFRSDRLRSRAMDLTPTPVAPVLGIQLGANSNRSTAPSSSPVDCCGRPSDEKENDVRAPGPPPKARYVLDRAAFRAALRVHVPSGDSNG